VTALAAAGHEIVGVFTVEDTKRGEDPIVAAAAALPTKPLVHKCRSWRRKTAAGEWEAEPTAVAAYRSVTADLNVLAFVTQLIPAEVTEACTSLCYHPSILPRHRGASAINWTLMEGDEEAGLTLFYPDQGLDTGDICLIRRTKVEPDDTVNSLYKRFLFPEGVKAFVEAAAAVAAGTAPRSPQPAQGASYDPIWRDRDAARLDLARGGGSTKALHDFVRGNDSTPGAWIVSAGRRVVLFGAHLAAATEDGPSPHAATLPVDGYHQDVAPVDERGIWLQGAADTGAWLVVAAVSVGDDRSKGRPLDLLVGETAPPLAVVYNRRAESAARAAAWSSVVDEARSSAEVEATVSAVDAFMWVQGARDSEMAATMRPGVVSLLASLRSAAASDEAVRARHDALLMRMSEYVTRLQSQELADALHAILMDVKEQAE
jgi:methionyl-tRNA formyltransferase